MVSLRIVVDYCSGHDQNKDHTFVMTKEDALKRMRFVERSLLHVGFATSAVAEDETTYVVRMDHVNGVSYAKMVMTL